MPSDPGSSAEEAEAPAVAAEEGTDPSEGGDVAHVEEGAESESAQTLDIVTVRDILTYIRKLPKGAQVVSRLEADVKSAQKELQNLQTVAATKKPYRKLLKRQSIAPKRISLLRMRA